MIKTTYFDVQRAYIALHAISGDKGYKADIPLATALRIRRTLGVMRPLVSDYEEMREQLVAASGWDKASPAPSKLDDEIRELMAVDVEVGVDPFTAADLSLPDMVPASIVTILFELGPFFSE